MCTECILYHFHSYDDASTEVEVTDGAALVVNFTLKSHDLTEWSKAYDFMIMENLKNDSYYMPDQIEEALKTLARYSMNKNGRET